MFHRGKILLKEGGGFAYCGGEGKGGRAPFLCWAVRFSAKEGSPSFKGNSPRAVKKKGLRKEKVLLESLDIALRGKNGRIGGEKKGDRRLTNECSCGTRGKSFCAGFDDYRAGEEKGLVSYGGERQKPESFTGRVLISERLANRESPS